VRCPGFKRKRLAKLFAALGFTRGAEIGVREGVFSEVLCKAIPGLELLCVDLWDAYYHFASADGARHYLTAQKRLAAYNARLVKATSMDAAREIADESLDFVYIDADHRFDWVMQDLIEWSKKVRPGGIVSGHDYYRFRNAGVVPAVDVYTLVHGIHEWFITDEKEASFFWVKEGDNGLSK
jgi:predicted O-methyltransferase YrrM